MALKHNEYSFFEEFNVNSDTDVDLLFGSLKRSVINLNYLSLVSINSDYVWNLDLKFFSGLNKMKY